jgi:acetylornithine deacetylase/succinyl-diaminopimelate desuccinylase-like protein
MPDPEFLGIPTVSAGIGHFNSNIHAPNENIKISDLVQGSKLIAALISEFAEMEE